MISPYISPEGGYPFVSRSGIIFVWEKKAPIRCQVSITLGRLSNLKNGFLLKRHASNICVVCDGVLGFGALAVEETRHGPLAEANYGVQNANGKPRLPPAQYSRGPRSLFVSGFELCGM